MCLNSFFIKLFSEDNLIAALTGSFIGGIWWLLFEGIKQIKYWQKYRKYEGHYKAYLKNDLSKDEFDIYIHRRGNKFIIIGTSLTHDEPITGFIEMSSSINNYGKGYYRHDNPIGQVSRFGFYEIQLASKDILVHQQIKGLNHLREGEDKSASYVWVKVIRTRQGTVPI